MSQHTEITNVIAEALLRAERTGYTKPHDFAIAVRVDLKQAGFRIVRAPQPRRAEP
jgi:hypothetical protein